MRFIFKFNFALIAFLLIFLTPVLSNAAIYYVNDDTGNDAWAGSSESPFATIQMAVEAAHSNDEIRVAEGTYTGVSAVDPDGSGETYYQVVSIMDKSLTLIGGYDIRDWNTSDPELNVTTIDAQGDGRCITIKGSGSEHVTVDGFTITGGDYTDLGNANESLPTPIRECRRSGSDCGGGLYARSVTLILKNSVVTDNNASDTSNNSEGGGIYFHSCSDGSEIDNVLVSNNACTPPYSEGGGLRVQEGSNLTITNCDFLNNISTSGGAVYVQQPNGTVTIENTIFSGNTSYTTVSESYGGAISANLAYTGETAFYVSKSTFTNNNADIGSAIYLQRYGSDTCSVLMDNLIFSNNTSDYVGSTNSLIYNIVQSGNLELSYRHLTAANNAATSFLYTDTSSFAGETISVKVNNTIIDTFTNALSADENSPCEVVISYDGLLINNVTNMINTYSGAPTFSAGETITGDPKLDSTYHLMKGSPAINAGIDAGVTTDIDGDSRPKGLGYDIGADEFIQSGVNAGMLLMLLN